jgi:signal peptidase I
MTGFGARGPNSNSFGGSSRLPAAAAKFAFSAPQSASQPGAKPEKAQPDPAASPPPGESRKKGGFLSWLWEWAKSITFALVVWLFLRTFLIEAFRIPSGSMENTLLIGDFLFVNKLLYGAEVPLIHKRLPAVREPRRHDVVVFDSVEEEGLKVVKRLVGMPGDTLEMKNGELYHNGVKVDEPWARHGNPGAFADAFHRAKMREWQVKHLVGRDTAEYNPDLHDWGPIEVPADHYFMMGDNRDDSYDGRYWGFLPRENVRGRPLFVYFSFDPNSWRPLPFFTAVRWGRIFSTPR